MAALTARGRGLDCFQPQPRQPVLRAGRTLCVYAERSACCSLPRLPTLCFPLARPASTRSSRTARAFPLCGVARVADIKLPKCIEKICPSTIPPEKTTGRITKTEKKLHKFSGYFCNYMETSFHYGSSIQFKRYKKRHTVCEKANGMA